jgi:excisionase family DNA binding protein
VNASEVTDMALTANQLARRLNCSWTTVKRAIKRGELKAVWDSERREWLIEEGGELAFFRAKLEHWKEVRRFRSSLMKTLWQTGRLKPRKRKQVPTIIVERLKRPLMITIGQGLGTRTAPISWQGNEGQAACPVCGTALKIR